jgi:hypothetical protein
VDRILPISHSNSLRDIQAQTVIGPTGFIQNPGVHSNEVFIPEIRIRDKLLIILPKSFVKSEWVGDEVKKAIAEEKEQKALKLFLIRLDNAVLKAKDDWLEKIRLRWQLGDFSGWKDKVQYERAFDRSLKDLEAQ